MLDELIDQLDSAICRSSHYYINGSRTLEWFVCTWSVEQQWIYLVSISICYDSLLGWSHYTMKCLLKFVELIVLMCRWPNCSSSFGPAVERRLRSYWCKIREGESQIWCTQSAKKCKEQVPPHPVSTCHDRHNKGNIPLVHSSWNEILWNRSSHHQRHCQCWLVLPEPCVCRLKLLNHTSGCWMQGGGATRKNQGTVAKCTQGGGRSGSTQNLIPKKIEQGLKNCHHWFVRLLTSISFSSNQCIWPADMDILLTCGWCMFWQERNGDAFSMSEYVIKYHTNWEFSLC